MATNTFFVAANIIYDLDTGKKTNVLMLVNRQEDATFFSHKDAMDYMAFIQHRSPEIRWELTTNFQRLTQYVIKGVQFV